MTDRHDIGDLGSLTFVTVLVVACASPLGVRARSAPVLQSPAAARPPADAKAFLDTRQRHDAAARHRSRARPAGSSRPSSPTTPKRSPRARTRRYIDAIARFAKDATKFDKVEVPADQRRQLNLLKLSLVMATPSDPKEAEELTKIMARLESTYGKGKWCPDPAKPDTCKNIDDVTQGAWRRRATRRQLRAVWEGWHTISPPMRKDYARFVELSNKGAKELGLRRHRRDVAREVRHAARRRSPRSSIGCGIRCGRSISSCTPTCA